MNVSHKQRLQQTANSIRDSKLRGKQFCKIDNLHIPLLWFLLDLILFGVGYHHAGMDIADRRAVEIMFTAGDLPVLCELKDMVTSLLKYYSFFLQLPPAPWQWGYVLKCVCIQSSVKVP